MNLGFHHRCSRLSSNQMSQLRKEIYNSLYLDSKEIVSYTFTHEVLFILIKEWSINLIVVALLIGNITDVHYKTRSENEEIFPIT